MIHASSKEGTFLFLITLLLTIASFVTLVAKSVADSKIKKLRLGINPQYLVKNILVI